MLKLQFKVLKDRQRAEKSRMLIPAFIGLALAAPTALAATDYDYAKVRRAHFDVVVGNALWALAELPVATAPKAWLDDDDSRGLLPQEVYARAAIAADMPELALDTARSLQKQGGLQAQANRAWLAIAERLYTNQNYADAAKALDQLGKVKQADSLARMQYLSGQLALQRGDIEEAIRIVEKWKGGDSVLSVYLKANIGSALVEKNRIKQGLKWLKAAASAEGDDIELAAVRDRAQLYTGYAYLTLGKPAKGRAALEKVRLDGVDTQRALLGLGWADISRSQDKDALAPWLYLTDQNQSDAAVQEAYLLAPFALTRLNAHGKSIQVLEKAVNLYSLELQKLEKARQLLNRGVLMPQIEKVKGVNAGNWQEAARQVLGKDLFTYLSDELNKNELATAVQRYMNLYGMELEIGEWMRQRRPYSKDKAQKILASAATLKKGYSRAISAQLNEALDKHITRLKEYRSHAQFTLAESYERLSYSGEAQ